MAFEWDTEVHGGLLRSARLSEEWSRAQLADQLGVSYLSIRNWEEGSNSPQSTNIERLMELFGEGVFTTETEARSSDDASPLAVWMRRKREEKGWSRHMLSQEASVSYPTIVNIETGRTLNPQQRTKEKIESALGDMVPEEVDAEITQAANIGVEGIGALTDFDPHSQDDLPEVPGIYVFYDVSDRPIYVGQAKTISSRIKNGHWDKFWYRPPIVDKAAFVRVDDAILRDQIERVMIRFLKSNAVINKQLVERDLE